MCNRYALSKKQERIIVRDYGSLEFYFSERFNIAPTQLAPIVLVENGKLVCRDMKWGFIPKWSKAPVTNAQFETLDKKEMFKEAFETRRCLIPASGFYEWQDFGGRKQPILFLLKDEQLFFFAGLYSARTDDERFVIVTTASNPVVGVVHNRMPLILSPDDYASWIASQSQNYKAVKPSPQEMKSYWVSDRMNSSRNEDPEAAQPLTASVKGAFGGYALPEGLPAGATVKIRSFNSGRYDVEFQGKDFNVYSACVSFKDETGTLL